jgi:hypothetical protein
VVGGNVGDRRAVPLVVAPIISAPAHNSRARTVRLAAVALAAAGLAASALSGLASTVGSAPAGSNVFTIYSPPADSAGAHTGEEPSIGADWKTGAVMYQSLLTTYRVTFDSAKTPAATWTDVSAPLTSRQSLDPILFTDRDTGRTIVSQLAGQCSLSEYSDDDGATWTPDEGCGPPSGVDHQSVGGGPFAAPLTGGAIYPHAVYYCSQAVAAAFCAMSPDGGVTYATGVPIYSLAQCGGLHGHVRVGPDGTAIVPNQACAPAPVTGGVTAAAGAGGSFPNQAAVVSTDNGVTWTVNVIPDSVATSRSDPAAAADSAGTWFFGYEGAVLDGGGTQVGGHPMISTSKDGGTTWSPSVDVGAVMGLQNVTFPEVIAGDPGRAAYAFLGSPTAGNPEMQTFQGLWYLYVALTYDGGATWTVQNLTPGDPVERGCMFLAGNGDCPSPAKRNLYDFMDVTADKDGHVLIGYADGCSGTCDTQQSAPCDDAACDKGATGSTDHLASIARLTCGRGLVAAQDSAMSCGGGSTAAPQPQPGASPPDGSPPVTAAIGIPNTAGPAPAAALPSLAALGIALGAGPWRRRRRSG